MKQLSIQLRDLIASLPKKPSVLERALHRTRWNLDAIDQLACCGEPAAIPHLTSVVFSGNSEEVLRAARAIERLLSGAAIDDLPWVDELMRRGWYGEGRNKLEARELAKWVGPDEPGILLLRLSAMHPNGFVREEAVRRLRLIQDGSELPFLLLRLNDWVPQVRRLALDSILDRIRADYAGRFADNLVLIARLRDVQRNDQSDVLDRITKLLLSPAVRGQMFSAMRSGSRIVRRTSFQILRSADPDVLPEILLPAAREGDVVIRLWAIRALLSVLEQRELRSVLLSMSSDPSGPVRLEVLRALAQSSPEEATSLLMSALLDANASVRTEARFRLRNKSGADFRQFYKDAITAERSTEVLMAAIAGLAETGKPEDAKTLVPFLTHSLPKVRRTAVRCLAKVAGEEAFPGVWDRLFDRSPGASNEACKLIWRYSYRLVPSKLWELFRAPNEGHIRRNLLRLLAALPKWDSISYLIRATHDTDSSLAAQAHSYVRRWNSRYNLSQTAPTSKQVEQLEAALVDAGRILPASLVESIRFSLKAFEG